MAESGAGRRAKDQKMAQDLVRRGYFHGKRAGKGLDNVPRLTDVGSAAYRRSQFKNNKRG